MAIFRTARYDEIKYTRIPNALLRGGTSASEREDGIGPDSLGVLVYLLSHAETWRITNVQISKFFGISTGKVTRITRELAEAGYLVKAPLRDKETGTITGWDWVVYDSPDRDLPDLENTTSCKDKILITANKEQIETKEQIEAKEPKSAKKERLLRSPPAGASAKAWIKWVEFKSKSTQLGDKVEAQMRASFFGLVRGGFDQDEAIDYVIAQNWKSFDAEWSSLSVFKGQAKQNKIMELVK